MSSDLSPELADFISAELRVPRARLSVSARLLHDLGVDGGDGFEFIEVFGRKFAVDLSGFEPSHHFGPEAGMNPFLWVWRTLAGSQPKLIPITLGDLEASIRSGRWESPNHEAV